ncbi:UDP-N-acetylmuramate dehydrogenase [Microbacterium thalassium]|uniref:UDP-N-acetylenolpyruvoylglucosamine reductase n=1 Tax=Microbacterium thalassium TaxID=362649 RepID=A0A7X0FPG0_9MICO|nr:UDP-N-acetylmuramate dehydrogenase [Microbacterium thalassium]MBB6391302.1 UDP-N-acetylmuramate dehydrogenase [Microbacterium thalassium]
MKEIAPGGVHVGLDLAQASSWRIGGPADIVVEPENFEQVAAFLRLMGQRPEPVLVIGETTNLFFDSRGFRGVLLRIGPKLAQVSIEGTRVRVQAGARVPELVRQLAEAGLGGISHAGGVPGTIGGLVLMNGGSQRKGIGTHVASVLVADADGTLRRWAPPELGFSYRHSALQGRRAVILEVELELESALPADQIAEIDAIIAERAAKFPLDLPSGGSVFLSDPGMYDVVGPPGRAIETAGLKGLAEGAAQISPKHANFIVNLGTASDDDVLRLIATARNKVRARTGFSMACEVRHVGPDGDLRVAHEVADERWPGLDLSE